MPASAGSPRGAAAPARAPRRRARVLAAVLALIVLVGGGLLLQSNRPDGTTPEPPSYPTVDGPLGDALTDLQGSVEP